MWRIFRTHNEYILSFDIGVGILLLMFIQFYFMKCSREKWHNFIISWNGIIIEHKWFWDQEIESKSCKIN